MLGGAVRKVVLLTSQRQLLNRGKIKADAQIQYERVLFVH